MIRTVAIALSGGVDSMIAAYLLKKEKYNLLGLHFLTGFENQASATKKSDPNEIDRIGDQLGISVHVVDLSRDFNAMVVNYFTRSYLRGKTPNPCLKCNPAIKFGLLMDRARQLGASHLATGHYARILGGPDNRMRLLKGKDTRKDQSYFLAFLNQTQLAGSIFPLGGMTKDQVKKMAKEQNLTPLNTNESQDICFIKDGNYTDFLANQPGFQPRPGKIVDSSGNFIGTHQGLHQYTIGQRRGINCPSSEPYYVNRIDSKNNRLIVGNRSDLLSPECTVRSVHWIRVKPELPVQVRVRVRYRHQAVAAELLDKGRERVQVRFKDPEPALTPGQGAVFYRGDEVLGAGWIEQA